ncbi:3-deoxy-manno-octulosonate cytidylyltransferase [Arachidicoccus sp.]|uniref:3-deoxy-manno-octulosonate cytidylyltransferase n=1 Tax=Arachidicoccus sp. TaxID=1872624 RepID=UPI003D198A6D
MKIIAIIPARYAATRFPAKLMQMLQGKPIIRHTYENTVGTNLFDEVIVATDSEIIFNEITQNGGNAIITKGNHESGSDRIAEVAREMEVDIIINIQGDTPFVNKPALEEIINVFKDETVQVASMMQILTEQKYIEDYNYVKVVVDKNMNSLLFSRSVIPYPRNKETVVTYYEHIGVYAFRKEALIRFTKWEMTPLEIIEKIECLRYLENGVPLRMIVVSGIGVEIDTPEDLERASIALGG